MEASDKVEQDVFRRLLDLQRLVETLEVRLGLLLAENAQLQGQVADLTKQIADLKAASAANGSTAKVDEAYSIRAEEKRQRARGRGKHKESKKQRRGRIANEEKIRRAEQTIDIFPDGALPEQCKLSHVRVVWRLIDSRPVLIAYRIFRGPNKQYGKIPGVIGRGEFGLEIMVALAHLVNVTNISIDKACAVLGFFQNLTLSKSQADAMLHQLAKHWENEFENLCALLANSLIVHADETGWSINSVWAMLSEKARVLLFGVHKDADTLKKLLDPETFAGLVISDDAAVYANFTLAQKCWAHLLRKAIKLTLQDPKNDLYRKFADSLVDIYHEAKRIQSDGRLSAEGRERKVAELSERVVNLCAMVRVKGKPEQGTLAYDHYLLSAELQRLAHAKQLFTFVTTAPIEQINGETQPAAGTNNEAERVLRDPAMARKTGRTSKTTVGARRTTILKSVLESLRLYVPSYTLKSVVDEVASWLGTGQSCFRRMMDKLKIALPKHSVLDKVLPLPEG